MSCVAHGVAARSSVPNHGIPAWHQQIESATGNIDETNMSGIAGRVRLSVSPLRVPQVQPNSGPGSQQPLHTQPRGKRRPRCCDPCLAAARAPQNCKVALQGGTFAGSCIAEG